MSADYPNFLTPEKLAELERLRNGLDTIQNAIDKWNDLNGAANYPTPFIMLWQGREQHSAHWKATEDLDRKIAAHHIDRLRFEHHIGQRRAA